MSYDYDQGAEPPPLRGVGQIIDTCFVEHGEDQQLAELYGALAKAQAGFQPVHRSKTVTIRPRDGQPYSFSYAPLEDLLAATRQALGTNGLAVLTPIVRGPSAPHAEVRVILSHQAGARLVASFAFAALADMKMLAGQITYLRRYAYSALLNLAADDDDDDRDDNRAEQQQAPKAARNTPSAKPPAKAAASITSDRDPIWLRWLQLVDLAHQHNIKAPTLTLPIDRPDLEREGAALKARLGDAASDPQPSASDTRITPNQTARIHVRLKEVGWTDDEYRKHLQVNFGVESSKELSSTQAASLIDHLVTLEPAPATGKDAAALLWPDDGELKQPAGRAERPAAAPDGPRMATDAQKAALRRIDPQGATDVALAALTYDNAGLWIESLEGTAK